MLNNASLFDLTVIVPYMSGNDMSEDCLRFVVSRLKSDLPSVEIIVSIQNPARKISIDGARIVYVHHHLRKFHKSRVVNDAMPGVRSEYVWVHDPDLVLPFGAVPSFIERRGLIKPIGCVIDLTEDETMDVLMTGGLDEFRSEEVHPESGGSSILMRRLLFQAVGGMDMGIRGKKWAELDLLCGASTKSNVRTLPLTGIRLWTLGRADDNEGEEAFKAKRWSMRSFFDVMVESGTKWTVPVGKDVRIGVGKAWIPPVPLNPVGVKMTPVDGNWNGRVVHIIAPALEKGGGSLRRREELTFQSIIEALRRDGEGVEVVFFTNSIDNMRSDVFKLVKPTRTSADIGDNRDLPYLSDMLKEAKERAGDGGVVVYTNSDNAVVPDFYSRIKGKGSPRVLFHRRNVYGCPDMVEELFSFKNEVFEAGVDGLMIRGDGWDGLDVIPLDFFVGEPHWDSAIGGYLYKHGMASKDVDCLYHPWHRQNWDEVESTPAGKHNYKLLIEFKKSIDSEFEGRLLKIVENTHGDIVNFDFHMDNVSSAISEIIFITAPVFDRRKKSLMKRELLALRSLKELTSRIDSRRILFTDSRICRKLKDFDVVVPERSSRTLIDDKRDMWLLSDILDAAESKSKDDDSLIFYFNSDCGVGNMSFLEDWDGRILEFHRNEVYGEVENLEDTKGNLNSVYETGVDGLALTAGMYRRLKASGFDFGFYVGEPHWDTAVCGRLRKMGVSDQRSGVLFHIKHDKAWNTKNLTPAGRYNEAVYREWLDGGLMDSHILSYDKKASVVVVHFGNEAKRLEAVRKAISKWQAQDVHAEWIFMEMVMKGEPSSFLELNGVPKFKHIIMECSPENIGIWQKEALMSAGSKKASTPVVVFLDSDVCSDDPTWLSRLVGLVEGDPSVMAQGFLHVRDTVDPHYQYYSLRSVLDSDGSNYNPGLVWAVSRRMLEENGHVNPFCIYGSGDSMLASEYLGGRYSELNGWCFQFPRFAELRRGSLRQAVYKCLDDEVWHVNHGGGNKHHSFRHRMTGWFTKPIRELVEMDSTGLLRWKNMDCAERMMVSRQREMRSEDDVRRICSEILENKNSWKGSPPCLQKN